ncbi:16S rRNA (uracil(1498)-N(3))-methyltransferase [Shimia sp. MMG029]|uniref:16S rRNA (uracil(1498)-N(3))-methyltransferase n=1 Tax=Shimia sp. MMG029 TaxID=3021978 RepID=UPI0022FE400F|nr:16S rRNA (uracil(1498)-N(3))-methyltransferase [Shimia sp. MMG029]MDA5558032.1 16S rRNA (uracil(1498)-N(3))-methyltransferase [Shimia sp. MMG029]
MKQAKVRLYVEQGLGEGQTIPLSKEQAHYLFGVMRMAVDDPVLLFNGRDGEWRCVVTVANKRNGELVCEAQTKPLQMPPDLWLCFAPIKKARTDFIVEKAAEMGAARIVPVNTDFTNSERIRQDRLQAHAVEAAEQCGGTYVPEVAELTKLDRLLADWPEGRQLMFCDEAEVGENLWLDTTNSGRSEGGSEAPADLPEANLRFDGGGSGADRIASDPISGKDGKPWAILIGPEGGFSAAERTKLRALPFAHVVSLGPRILRADTAAVAAMTLWQQALGDWG